MLVFYQPNGHMFSQQIRNNVVYAANYFAIIWKHLLVDSNHLSKGNSKYYILSYGSIGSVVYTLDKLEGMSGVLLEGCLGLLWSCQAIHRLLMELPLRCIFTTTDRSVATYSIGASDALEFQLGLQL